MKKNISIMIKPSSSMCNMSCTYCFYRSIAENRKEFSHGYMSLDTVRVVIKKAFEYASGGDISITFQGGEPLLIGKDFFRGVNKRVREYNVCNSNIMLSVQTNGTLIDDEWCDILKDYLIGISLDSSICEFNDLRVDNEGRETFERIQNAIAILKRRNIEFNVLSVVTKKVAENIESIFDSFAKEEIRYLQFIPCLKPYGKPDSIDDIYLSGEEYGEFLVKLFRLYYRYFTSGNYVSIRLFDNFVRLAAGKFAEQCGMNGYCSKQFIIEGNGDVYPCDFYCHDDYLLGNITNQSFQELENTSIAKSFIEESLVLSEKCRGCNIFGYCRGGGCKRERIDTDMCIAYKYFFENTASMLENLIPYC